MGSVRVVVPAAGALALFATLKPLLTLWTRLDPERE
jgi:hypothetical protein